MKNLLPRKRFGQNFLQDTSIIEAIIQEISPKKGDFLIEIGPGRAALTAALVKYVQPLYAIEIDRDLVQYLAQKFTKAQLVIYQADALQFDFGHFKSQIEPQRQIRILGNLPYNISTPLLFHLATFHEVIADMHVMLQKEVVDRIVAQPGSTKYGRLSVMLQYRFTVHKLFDVPAISFYPMPQVESAMMQLCPHRNLPYPAHNEQHFSQIVTKAFAQRRKTLRNSLQSWITKDQFYKANIDPERRPETLSVAEFVRLGNFL